METTQVTCSENAAPLLTSAIPRRLRRLQECFVALYLDARNRPIGRAVLISVGTVAGVDVHPRDVYRTAVKRNAVSVVIAHKHPSGELEPSKDDQELTKRMRAAGEMIGITLLDHLVIIANGDHLSFADRGLF